MASCIWVDVVSVVYPSFSKEICMAPFAKLNEGDEVETAFGRGTVTQILHMDKNSDAFKFFYKNMNLYPVLSVITKLEGVAVDNDLPEE